MAEIDHRREFRKRWLGWSSPNEPGLGSDNGAPDLFVVLPEGDFLVPVEIKVLSRFKDSKLFPRTVRPAQIEWCRSVREAGVPYMLLIGCPTGAIYSVDGKHLPKWKDGYIIGGNARLIHPHPSGLTERFTWHVRAAKKFVMRAKP